MLSSRQFVSLQWAGTHPRKMPFREVHERPSNKWFFEPTRVHIPKRHLDQLVPVCKAHAAYSPYRSGDAPPPIALCSGGSGPRDCGVGRVADVWGQVYGCGGKCPGTCGDDGRATQRTTCRERPTERRTERRERRVALVGGWMVGISVQGRVSRRMSDAIVRTPRSVTDNFTTSQPVTAAETQLRAVRHHPTTGTVRIFIDISY